MSILITGTSGFVGQRMIELWSNKNIEALDLRDLNWMNKDFSHCKTVIHLAGKAHDLQNPSGEEYYNVNFELTKQLLDVCIDNKCRQFIYFSTVKVYGDSIKDIITEETATNANDDYGKSKLMAEEYLLSKSNDIKIAIVRPPLIYGPGVKGNMLRLLDLAKKKLPIPIGGIQNKRSLVFIDNLIDLTWTIIQQGQEGIFIPLDQHPVSTSQIFHEIRKSMGNHSRLIPFPKMLQAVIRRLKPKTYERLFGDFLIDNSMSQKVLNFTPKITFADGIQAMVKDYESKF